MNHSIYPLSARESAPPRSTLYVPADKPDMLLKAASRGADALILDLEDAVAPGGKEAARRILAQYLQDHPRNPQEQPQLWLRINPAHAGLDDIREVWHPALSGVIAAKCETAADLDAIDNALTTREQIAGQTRGRTAVIPLLESATAVRRAGELAEHPRVARLQLGEADLKAELGLYGEGGSLVLQNIRSGILLLSAAAGISAPTAPVSTNFSDLKALVRETRLLAGMGFSGRACIHPRQVAVVNETFTPSAEAVERATRLVERYKQGLERAEGVMVDDDGLMVDEAVIRQARSVLARARR